MANLTSFQLTIPTQVVVTFNVRTLTLTGPVGEVTRDFNIALNIHTVENGTRLQVDVMHHWPNIGAKITRIRSVISFMITGCTRGFQCKLAFLILHLPIEITPSEDNRACEVYNYLSKRGYSYVKMEGDVTCRWADSSKSEFIVAGPDVNHVVNSAHMVHFACSFKRKDLKDYYHDTIQWNGEVFVGMWSCGMALGCVLAPGFEFVTR